MGSLSIWHWLIVLLVVVLIFGTKKLRNMGGDVGGAIKEFKSSMAEAKDAENTQQSTESAPSNDAVNVPKKTPAKRKVTTKATDVNSTATKKPATAKVATTRKPAAKKTASKPKD